ncbi:hypothetical protein CIK05_12680 [Bdellovibrio sp. qaytius]|nr:hypothetical protein CIK05_12680 [Bdellovibrio sp. qaytius]
MKTLAAAIVLTFALASCKKAEEPKAKVIVNNALASDFKVPEAVFTAIKKSMGEGVSVEPEYMFTDLEVEIQTDQKEVLSYSRLLFKLPNGGGAIDLKDYVTGDGSFYLRFPPEQFETKPELAFLFYISDSPKVKIRDEEYGLGCGQFVDLKPKFSKLQDKTFLKLNTTDHTYAHVLSGQYVFVFKKGIQYYLTHLNLFDSRYSDKMCTAIFDMKKDVTK